MPLSPKVRRAGLRSRKEAVPLSPKVRRAALRSRKEAGPLSAFGGRRCAQAAEGKGKNIVWLW